MAKKDWFTEGFGAAIGDIRRRLVEEGWFGRPVTEKPAATIHAEPSKEPDRKAWKPRPHRSEPSLSVSLNLAINVEAANQQHGRAADRDPPRSLTHDIDH